MSSSDLIVLAILPTVIWASLAYVTRSTTISALKLRTAWSAKTKHELIEGAQRWSVFAFIVFSIVLIGVTVWNLVQRSNALETILNPTNWERGIFHGIFFGLVFLGILLILWRCFPTVQKFRLVVMAAIASSPWVRTSILLLVVFTEELWRAVCLKALTGDGVSGRQALIATSIAYGLTFLAWGTPRAISEGIVGAALGGLFLWSGSFFVPLAAHITFEGQSLLYAIAAGPNAGPGDIRSKPFTKCPACGAMLGIRQINLDVNEAFFCPHCHVRVTSSDHRRWFLRWGTVLIFGPLLLAAWDIFPGALRHSTSEYWLSLALMLCGGLGLWSILQVLFPPKLECGDPDIVSLNLGDQDAARRDEDEPEEPDDADSK